jgi:hypothetical protein
MECGAPHRYRLLCLLLTRLCLAAPAVGRRLPRVLRARHVSHRRAGGGDGRQGAGVQRRDAPGCRQRELLHRHRRHPRSWLDGDVHHQPLGLSLLPAQPPGRAAPYRRARHERPQEAVPAGVSRHARLLQPRALRVPHRFPHRGCCGGCRRRRRSPGTDIGRRRRRAAGAAAGRPSGWWRRHHIHAAHQRQRRAQRAHGGLALGARVVRRLGGRAIHLMEVLLVLRQRAARRRHGAGVAQDAAHAAGGCAAAPGRRLRRAAVQRRQAVPLHGLRHQPGRLIRGALLRPRLCLRLPHHRGAHPQVTRHGEGAAHPRGHAHDGPPRTHLLALLVRHALLHPDGGRHAHGARRHLPGASTASVCARHAV